MKRSTVVIIVIAALVLVVSVYWFYFRSRKLFKRPVEGRVSSKFGNRVSPITGASQFHNGTDFAIPTGTPIRSPLDGEILKIYDTESGGKQMLVVHAGGWITGYAHLSSFNKNIGDKVKQSDVIGFSGNTGASTGPHLHFTLTDPKGNKVDPEQYFNKQLA